MASGSPQWSIPENLDEFIAADCPDGDGMWEDRSWDPITLTVLAGTSYKGRNIPFAWQIEFPPDDGRLEIANKRIESIGLISDGYGWAQYIERVFAERHPNLVTELHFDDTELEACVVWVESEMTCKTLMETIWSLMNRP